MTFKSKWSPGLIGLAALAIVVIGAAVAWIASNPGFWAPPNPTSAEVAADEFGRRVRQYLLDNPEVIVEAMQRFEQSQREAAEVAAQAVLRQRADEILRDPTSPVGGNPEGDVTLVEFFDYNCPYCRRMAPLMSEAVAADPQLRVVYKEFPILGPNSSFAAKMAMAVHRRDKSKYRAFHEALMQHKGPTDERAALATATEIGLDVEQLKTEMDHPEIAAALDRNLALAQALGINGTPAFIIGGHIIPGAVDLKTLQAAIEEARASQQGKQP